MCRHRGEEVNMWVLGAHLLPGFQLSKKRYIYIYGNGMDVEGACSAGATNQLGVMGGAEMRG